MKEEFMLKSDEWKRNTIQKNNKILFNLDLTIVSLGIIGLIGLIIQVKCDKFRMRSIILCFKRQYPISITTS